MRKSYQISWSVLVIILMATSWVIVNYRLKRWVDPGQVIVNDVISYYSYLPAVFVFQDITLNFKDNPNIKNSYKFWANKIPGKNYVIKMSMGLSFLYFPFFISAHIYCKLTGVMADGYSDPYEIALMISSLFYATIGFIFLRKILRIYFNDLITALCLLTIGWGTNLFNYVTIESCMSHVYLFCMFNIFNWYTYQWYQKAGWKNLVVIGLSWGLISLIRPSNILIILVFLLYDVKSFENLKGKILFFWQRKQSLLLIFFLFLLVWAPQIAYWKYNSGQFMFYSYKGEYFFFNHPHILKGFFSYRRGWLLYTPLMTFSLLGLIMMWKKIPEFVLGTIMFFIPTTYIILSWWCWWYGGGFGLRAFIDMYGLLALPMGCFYAWALQKGVWKQIAFTLLVLILISFQLFQNRQYYTGSIHWGCMSKRAYWESFLKERPPLGFQYMLEWPDMEGAQLTGVEKSERKSEEK